MNESSNPLFNLNDTQRENLFVYLREGTDEEVVHDLLVQYDCPIVTNRQLDQFFKHHARERWAKRIDRAAQEADALVTFVKQSPGEFSDAILAALGQEAFRQIVSGKVQPEALAKYTSLFLRAKNQQRAERALDLQNEKLNLLRRNATERALDAFARELPQHPAALHAFEQLKKELLDQTEHLEDSLEQ